MSKAEVRATFQGTLEQLSAFMTDTFKSPNQLHLNVEVFYTPRRSNNTQAYRICQILGLPSMQDMVDARMTELQELVRKDLKIGAIKLLREITACGLREAKDAIEAEMY